MRHPSEHNLESVDLQLNTSDGVNLRGWHIKSGERPSRLVVYFHENAGSKPNLTQTSAQDSSTCAKFKREPTPKLLWWHIVATLTAKGHPPNLASNEMRKQSSNMPAITANSSNWMSMCWAEVWGEQFLSASHQTLFTPTGSRV